MKGLYQNVVVRGRLVSQQLWIRFQLLKLKRSEPSRHGGANLFSYKHKKWTW